MSDTINRNKIISSGCLRQYCDYDIPYCGIIDDGKGTIALINSDINVVQYLEKNVLFYSKKVSLKINKVTHVVKKGDSLWALAKKLGVSVEDIVSSNTIKDINMIHVGEVLNIDVNIQYSYEVKTMVDIANFTNKGKENFKPLSESILYRSLDKINTYADNLGGVLKEKAGKSRIGNNFHIYAESGSGKVFYGNQYVKTYSLKSMGEYLTKYTKPAKWGKGAIPLAMAFEGIEIYDGYMQDAGTFGYNAQKQMAGMAGSISGGMVGAAIGAKIGGMIGGALSVWFGGIGALPGLIIGGFIGGLIGGEKGEEGAEYLYDKISKNVK